MSDDHSERVNQAVAMIRVQADCTQEDAFVLLHERAQISGVTMGKLVDRVLDGSSRFGRDSK